MQNTFLAAGEHSGCRGVQRQTNSRTRRTSAAGGRGNHRNHGDTSAHHNPVRSVAYVCILCRKRALGLLHLARRYSDYCSTGRFILFFVFVTCASWGVIYCLGLAFPRLRPRRGACFRSGSLIKSTYTDVYTCLLPLIVSPVWHVSVRQFALVVSCRRPIVLRCPPYRL